MAFTHQHIWGLHGPWFSPLEGHPPPSVSCILGPSSNREVFIDANYMLVFSRLSTLNPINRYTSERGHGIFQGKCMSIYFVPGPVLDTVDPTMTKMDTVPALLELSQTDDNKAVMGKENGTMGAQRSCLTPPRGSRTCTRVFR